MMGKWDDHARSIERVLGPSLGPTDRWGRYIQQPGGDRRPGMMFRDAEKLRRYLHEVWPGTDPAPLDLRDRLKTERRRQRPDWSAWGRHLVPMPYRGINPPRPMTLEYRPEEHDGDYHVLASDTQSATGQPDHAPYGGREIETVTATPLGRMAPEDRLTRRVDWGFIADREGVKTQGYVPRNDDDAVDADSGVTIAAGFDLGKRSERSLRALGLPSAMVEAFRPYLGLKGNTAESFLAQNPLTITPDQERLISSLIFQQTYDDVARRYNADAFTAFRSLPRDVQTAITSLAFQYGTNLEKATPDYWGQVTNGAWQDAYKNLKKFGDRYQPRRDLEAVLLKQAIDAGKLPVPHPGLPDAPFGFRFDPVQIDY